ncbi:transposase [Xanthomonas theicola]|uniref:transposase n=1 Tax=Xanthomonas theicola TaxID=56464 RepID=UPI001304F30A|nr:transposase [Xanthomonas theicola]QNH24385.1 transposase [Xanthomonas theicola]
MGQVQGWAAQWRDAQGVIPIQVCAWRKSARQTRLTLETLHRTARRKGRKLRPRTMQMAGYVVLVGTLRDQSPERLLELYRYRRQVELAFKRLKWLLQRGHLKKTDPQGAKAWLQGNVFVSVLIESLLVVGGRFSPWGYLPASGQATVPLARGVLDAPPAEAGRQSDALVAR